MQGFVAPLEGAPHVPVGPQGGPLLAQGSSRKSGLRYPSICLLDVSCDRQAQAGCSRVSWCSELTVCRPLGHRANSQSVRIGPGTFPTVTGGPCSAEVPAGCQSRQTELALSSAQPTLGPQPRAILRLLLETQCLCADQATSIHSCSPTPNTMAPCSQRPSLGLPCGRPASSAFFALTTKVGAISHLSLWVPPWEHDSATGHVPTHGLGQDPCILGGSGKMEIRACWRASRMPNDDGSVSSRRVTTGSPAAHVAPLCRAWVGWESPELSLPSHLHLHSRCPTRSGCLISHVLCTGQV